MECWRHRKLSKWDQDCISPSRAFLLALLRFCLTGWGLPLVAKDSTNWSNCCISLKVAGRQCSLLCGNCWLGHKLKFFHYLVTLSLSEKLTLYFNLCEIVFFNRIFLFIGQISFKFDKVALQKKIEMFALECHLRYCFQSWPLLSWWPWTDPQWQVGTDSHVP